MNGGSKEREVENSRDTLFGQVLKEYERSLRRFCSGFEMNQGAREDLFQEILIQVWRSLGSFRCDSSLRTWVFRVASNVSISHARRGMRRKTRDFSPKLETGAVEESTGTSDMEQQLDNKRDLERLREKLMEFKPIDRQVLILSLEGLSQAEIAEVSGLSKEAVSTRLNRLRGKLSRAMERRRP